MNKEHHAIYEILRDFAIRHITSRGEFDPYKSTAEIDGVLQRIDQARGTGEEPDEAPGQEASGADNVGNLQRWLMEKAPLFGPFVTSTLLAGHIRVVKRALKESAHADVVRAIIDCERFLEEIPDEVDRGNRVITYLQTMIDLEAHLAAELDPSRAVLEEKNNGN